MSMVAGSISMDPTTHVVSGTGLAKFLWDDYAARPTFFANANPPAFFVDLINSIAQTVAYIAAHAVVTVNVTATDSGLQRTPNPNNANADTQGPSTTKTLSGGIS